MQLKTSIRISTIMDLFVVLVILSYAGPFASYSGITLLIAITGGIFLLYSLTLRENRKKNLNAWIVCIGYLMLNSLLNLPYSLKYMLILVVGYLMIRRNIKAENCKNVYRIIEIASTIEAVSIIIQRHIPDVFYPIAKTWFFYSDQFDFVSHAGQYSKQFSGLCYEVSFAAIVCSLGIIIRFVSMLFDNGKSRKIIDVLLIAMSFYSIILTGKRSIMIDIPITMAVIYLLFSKKNLTAKRIAIIGISLVTILILLPNIYTLVETILSRGRGSGIEWTNRTKFWALAFDMFKDNPLIGKGLNSFDIWFNRSGIRSIYYDFAGAHNSYFQLLGETGIIGICLYLWALFSSIRKGIIYNGLDEQNNKYILISVGILITLLIYAFSGNTLHQPQQLFCVLWCVAVLENLSIVRDEEFNNAQGKLR